MSETSAPILQKARLLLSKDIAILVTVLGLAGGAIYQMGKANQRIDELDRRVATIESIGSPAMRALTVRMDDLQSQMIGFRTDIGTRISDTERRARESDDRLQIQIGHLTDLMQQHVERMGKVPP